MSKRKSSVTVISGIDTDIGKTVATGLLARWYKDNGQQVVTMKMAQTGCKGLSEDIVEHRKLAGMEMVEEDAMGTTCPYVFEVPCSPHLAALIERKRINQEVIKNAVQEVSENYQHVLLEGVGGLMVPLNEDYLIIDLLQECEWPVILVTGPRLGSINHTLAAIEIIQNRGVDLQGIIYNLEGSQNTDQRIVEDSRECFARKLDEIGRKGRICDIPSVSCTNSYCVDFSPLFS